MTFSKLTCVIHTFALEGSVRGPAHQAEGGGRPARRGRRRHEQHKVCGTSIL